MKKIIYVFLMIAIIGSVMYGCEKAVAIRAATITEGTAAGSKNYVVKVGYSEDKRFKGKGTDVQIKFSKVGNIKIGKENQEKIDYEIKDFDEWYSMTQIFSDADQTSVRGAKFEKFENVLSKSYILNYDGYIKVTFRVVVGDIEENSTGDGEILVASQAISDNFTLKIK